MDVYVLNKNFELAMIMDVYESLIWTDRYSGYGDFEIYTSMSKEVVMNVLQNYYIVSKDSEHSMIVEGLQIKTDVESGNHYTITGRSLESILDRRIVLNTIVLDGTLESQIEKLLNETFINPEDPKRKIEGFTFKYSNDPYIESLRVQAQYTGDNVYSIINKLCIDGRIGFKITFDENFNLVFQLYAGKDRSYNQVENPYVIFSPNFENITNSEYLNDNKKYKTIALVAGEGEGSSRKKILVGNDELTGLDRRELYVDAGDLTSNTDGGTLTPAMYEECLTQRGKDELLENKTVESFEGQVEANKIYKYGTDFYMGDICQLENEFNMQSTVRVIEYIYSENTSGIETYPTFEIENNL